jgi:hypothetical protein
MAWGPGDDRAPSWGFVSCGSHPGRGIVACVETEEPVEIAGVDQPLAASPARLQASTPDPAVDGPVALTDVAADVGDGEHLDA